MPRLLKVLLFPLIFCFAVTIFTKPTYAASQTLEALTSPGVNLQKFILGEDVINAQGPQGMITSLADGFVIMALGAKDEDGNIISQGATGQLFALSNVMYQQPAASSKQYLAYLSQRLNLTPPAYAQSGGIKFLNPTIKLWEASRNVVYIFFVIIFVAIGFMIMFRAKLNPQTVIGIQQALPKIIISLILVTFSFAICGLIVDLAYLGNNIIYNIFYEKFVVDGAYTWSADATPFELIAASGIGKNLTTALESIAKVLSGGGPAALFNVIIAMTVVSTAFKIFFNLLTKYIAIFIIALLSPFAILLSSLPKNDGATLNIFKQLISAVLVFPATYFMVNLAYYFAKYAEETSADFQNLDPFKLKDFVDVAGKEEIAIATIAGLISLGVLMAAAQIPQVIENSLNLKPTLGAGTGQEIGGALRKIPLIGGIIG